MRTRRLAARAVTLWAMMLSVLVWGGAQPAGASALRRESCAEIRAASPTAADGSYVIYPNGRAFVVYCHDMATANVNLVGTPFAVVPGQFAPAGYGAAGTATYGANGQVVEVKGGGNCGWMSPPGPHPGDPNGSYTMQLVWAGLPYADFSSMAG